MRASTSSRVSTAAVAALLLAGCSGTEAERSATPGTEAAATTAAATAEFANLSDLDIVELLPTAPADARIRYDESPMTFGDLRLPNSSAPERGYPLVVLIHGGQWESSYTLDYMAPLAEALTDAGVATWNIEFRRLNNPGGGFPGTFHDIATGVDFVRGLAEDHPIDLERIVLTGHSSGGHLATWAAGRKNLPADSRFRADDPLSVTGVIDLAGVLDLEYAYEQGREDILMVLDAADGEELSQKAPETSSMNVLPLGVPQTIVIGTEDSPWRVESHDRYRNRAQEGGDVVDLVSLEGANHFDVIDPCSPAWGPIASAVLSYVGMDAGEDALALDADHCAPQAD